MGKRKRQIIIAVITLLVLALFYYDACIRETPLLGIKVLRVSGSSMLPTYEEGDIVVCLRSTSMKVGSVYVYQTSSRMIMHRLVESKDGLLWFKGDGVERGDAPVENGVIRYYVLFQ